MAINQLRPASVASHPDLVRPDDDEASRRLVRIYAPLQCIAALNGLRACGLAARVKLYADGDKRRPASALALSDLRPAGNMKY